jgi:uncharacterized glyoxalase superfamily metalloenzyme YdcJ
MKGILPWQNLNVPDKDKTKKVGEMKMKISTEELCKDLPKEFQLYMDYSKNLGFEELPDYNYLIELFKKIAIDNDINYEDYIWDWSKGAFENNLKRKSNSNKTESMVPENINNRHYEKKLS